MNEIDLLKKESDTKLFCSISFFSCTINFSVDRAKFIKHHRNQSEAESRVESISPPVAISSLTGVGAVVEVTELKQVYYFHLSLTATLRIVMKRSSSFGQYF